MEDRKLSGVRGRMAQCGEDGLWCPSGPQRQSADGRSTDRRSTDRRSLRGRTCRRLCSVTCPLSLAPWGHTGHFVRALSVGADPARLSGKGHRGCWRGALREPFTQQVLLGCSGPGGGSRGCSPGWHRTSLSRTRSPWGKQALRYTSDRPVHGGLKSGPSQGLPHLTLTAACEWRLQDCGFREEDMGPGRLGKRAEMPH